MKDENTMILGNTKVRILQYLEYKGVSKPQFYTDIDIKRGLLDSDKMNSTVVDTVIAKILVVYNDIDPMWLLTGHGSMLRTVQAQSASQPSVREDSSGESAIYYKMYEKKDAEVGILKEEVGALKLKISQLESGNLANPKAKVDAQSKEPKVSGEVEPQAPDHPPLAFDGGFIESFTSESSGGSAKDSIPMRSPTTSLKKSSASKT